MDHKEAVKIQAVERYLLQEMTVGERDAFEEHCFDCSQCREELEAGATLCDNLQACFEDEPQRQLTLEPRRRWSFAALLTPKWAMAAVVVLLAGVVAVQNVVTIPQLKRLAGNSIPRALPSISLAAAMARGEGAESSIVISKTDPLGLYVDIPPYPPYESYTCELVTEGGKTVFTVSIPAEQAHDTVQLFVPAGLLDSSRYLLVVRGNHSSATPKPEGDELARHYFNLKTKP